MDEMELFAVIDSSFVTKIDLNRDDLDFPKIKYEGQKI